MKYNIRLYPLVDDGYVDIVVDAETYDQAFEIANDKIIASHGIYENDAKIAPELDIKSLDLAQLADMLDWANMQICGSMTLDEAEDGWRTVKDYLRLLSATGIITNREKWVIHNYVMEWAKDILGEVTNDR